MVSMNAGLTLLKLLGIADGDVLVEGRRYSMLQVLEHCGIVHTKCYLSRVSMDSCSRILWWDDFKVNEIIQPCAPSS
jgi:hypothetical protein